MASNIKGITIEISGNTTKLESALKNVNKTIYSTNSELKQLNQALKLDPKNTELLAQKQDVLKKNIQATTEKINSLKEAQRQMGSYSSLTEEQKEQYRGLSVEIAKSENALKKLNDEGKKHPKKETDDWKEKLKSIGTTALDVSKKVISLGAAVTGALAGALTGLVAAGVKSYAELEQNLGGVETLFGDSANKVVENAKKAYKTAGVSANEYMAGVTSFSASLLQSLGGDTAKAADVADMAFRDMSDNANKFGTDMQSIQNAYQGFAKQNYTMLDNLKLGYGGTKTEMERLLADAEKFSGIHYDINNLSDVYNAIHVIQEEMGVTGTTAEEAEKTISGSVNSMKAAFDNFINGSGGPEELADAITNVLTNIAGAIEKLAPSILKGVVSLIQTLLPQVVKLINDLLPKLVNAVVQLIPELITAIVNLLPQLLDSISSLIDQLLAMFNDTTQLETTITFIITKIVEFITTNLPKIIELGLKLIVALAKGIAESLPTLIPTIIECVLTIVKTLIENLPMIIEAGLQLLIGLIKGIVDALPQLIEMLPTIIETIVTVLIENLPLIIEAAIEIMIALIEGLIKAIPQLVAMIPQIIIAIVNAIVKSLPKIIESGGKIISALINGISSMIGTLGSTMKQVADNIINGIKDLPNKMTKWGKDMIQGLINGIKGMIGNVGSAVKGLANKIKSFLHFSRPDEGPLREYETWMPDFIKGLAKGIDKSSYLVENATQNLADVMANTLSIDSMVGDVDAAMRGLNSQVSASINPTINPNVAYETNYRLMAKAVKEALEDMDVVMDDERMGKFVTKTVAEEIYS